MPKAEITMLDELPSALSFMKNFENEAARNPLQLFSGEGESLILAKWLGLHKIEVDGLFCFTDYGKFWKVHEEAKRKWDCLGESFLHLLVINNEDPTTLFCFGHDFSIKDDLCYYNINAKLIKWIKFFGYQNIIMGFRKVDFYRHLKRKDYQKQFIKAFNKPLHSTGKVPTETNLNIWFPFYDLGDEMKAELLRELEGECNACKRI